MSVKFSASVQVPRDRPRAESRLTHALLLKMTNKETHSCCLHCICLADNRAVRPWQGQLSTKSLNRKNDYIILRNLMTTSYVWYILSIVHLGSCGAAHSLRDTPVGKQAGDDVSHEAPRTHNCFKYTVYSKHMHDNLKRQVQLASGHYNLQRNAHTECSLYQHEMNCGDLDPSFVYSAHNSEKLLAEGKGN